MHQENTAYCLDCTNEWLSHISRSLRGLAAVAAGQGQTERSARLIESARALREAIGASPLPADYERDLPATRARLDEAEFRTEGMTPAPEQANAARRRAPAPEPGGSPSSRPAGLSPREVEVLGLVARGLTDARVAEELFISLRTVNAHVRSIYAKLNVGTRGAATRYALEHQLV